MYHLSLSRRQNFYYALLALLYLAGSVISKSGGKKGFRLTEISDFYVVSTENHYMNTRRVVNPEFVPNEIVQINWAWNDFPMENGVKVIVKHVNDKNAEFTITDSNGYNIIDREYEQARVNGKTKNVPAENAFINFKISPDWPSGKYYVIIKEYEIDNEGKIGNVVGISAFHKLSFMINNKYFINRKHRLGMHVNRRVDNYKTRFMNWWNDSHLFSKVKTGVKKYSGYDYVMAKIDGTPRSPIEARRRRDEKTFRQRY